MNVSEFLTNLTQQGVQMWVDDDKLSIRSPKGILTPEVHTQLTAHKIEILEALRQMDISEKSTSVPSSQGLSLQTMGRLIGGFVDQSTGGCKSPTIDPIAMARKLTVTFRPLPKSYKNEEIVRFREELKIKLQDYGVKVLPWEQATTEFRYKVTIPVVQWNKSLKKRVVRAEVDAVIDVERPSSLRSKAEIFAAENLYKIYSHFIHREISVPRIAMLTAWAEEHAAKYIEDPTSTQVIIITELDKELVNPQLPYQDKIKIGLNTLVRTFSEIVLGVSSTNISILNMNLSDSIVSKDEIGNFVLNSLIPKIFVPIMPLPLSRFEIEKYNPCHSKYADKLVSLGKELAETNLFPAGSKMSQLIRRKSHRDIVNVIMNGRTGVSYGFVAYAEPPQYVGEIEITESEWENLSPVDGFSIHEIRQNGIGRRYVKTRIREKYVFKQIPDIWLVSSRSGSNKTDLNLETDILRIGLKETLFLQMPEGVDPDIVDIKPSYDLYVMLAISLSAALYAPELIKNGAPIVHFHGYPSPDWFGENEYCVGIHNPSVPCGTYESGVFNFLGISGLAEQPIDNIALVGLIEPDHGTNIIAHDLEHLMKRLKVGRENGQIELGGKHFATLKAAEGDR